MSLIFVSGNGVISICDVCLTAQGNTLILKSVEGFSLIQITVNNHQ